MDNLVVIKGLSFLFGILIFICSLSYLVYYLFKRKNKIKTAKIVGLSTFTISIMIMLYIMFGFPFLMFEQYYFFKSTAIERLKQANVELEDDFKILDHEVKNFLSYKQNFILKVSIKEVDRLIENKDYMNNNEAVISHIVKDTRTSSTTIKVIIDTKYNLLKYERYSD